MFAATGAGASWVDYIPTTVPSWEAALTGFAAMLVLVAALVAAIMGVRWYRSRHRSDTTLHFGSFPVGFRCRITQRGLALIARANATPPQCHEHIEAFWSAIVSFTLSYNSCCPFALRSA